MSNNFKIFLLLLSFVNSRMWVGDTCYTIYFNKKCFSLDKGLLFGKENEGTELAKEILWP